MFLTDAGSRWGTYVNGERIDEYELVPGDQFTIGETVMKLALNSETEGLAVRS